MWSLKWLFDIRIERKIRQLWVEAQNTLVAIRVQQLEECMWMQKCGRNWARGTLLQGVGEMRENHWRPTKTCLYSRQKREVTFWAEVWSNVPSSPVSHHSSKIISNHSLGLAAWGHWYVCQDHSQGNRFKREIKECHFFYFKGQLRSEVIATGRTRSRLSCFVEMREITAHLKADTDHSTEGKFNYAWKRGNKC